MNSNATSVSSDRNDQPENFGASWQELDEHFKSGLMASIQARCDTFGLTAMGKAYVSSSASS